MIPKKITTQTIIQNTTWKGIMEQIQKLWSEDFYITDFDHGNGCYRVIMSKGTGWNGQSIKTGNKFPEDKIDEGWNKGLSITNISHDGDDWIVIMSGIKEVTNQSWFTRGNLNDFIEGIKKYWDKGYTISCIAKDKDGAYGCAVSKSNYNGQTYCYKSGKFTLADLESFGKSNGFLISEFANLDGNGLFCVSSGNTGYTSQKIHREKTWERMVELAQNRWKEGYNITTVDCYNGEWYMVYSK